MHVALEVAGMPGRLSWALNNVSLISNHVLVHKKFSVRLKLFRVMSKILAWALGVVLDFGANVWRSRLIWRQES